MPHKPLQTYDRKMKRFVTASESKAVTADGISNNTELAVARKNIDMILEKDHEEEHDFIEKDDPEHSR